MASVPPGTLGFDVDDPFRTPLVECFRRGEVPRDVRLVAAQGTLVPGAHEQLVLLMVLADDPDEEVAATAASTIARLPKAALAAFLARPEVAPEVRTFFGEGRRVPSPALLVTDDGVPVAASDLAPVAEPGGDAAPPASSENADAAGSPGEATRLSVAQQLAQLTVADRIKVAMQGTREERAILVRDPNRLVASAVLSSPKLTESEVEAIARMSNVSEDVLRIVGTTRAWTKNYAVLAALARNAKTPIGISLTLLHRLTDRDVKMLAMDRNVPEAVRLLARKIATKGTSRRE